MRVAPVMLLLAACSTTTGQPEPEDTDDCEPIVVYTDADGDGYGDPATAQAVCEPPDAAVPGTDCDDADPAVHPGAEERCDGVDEDCDGTPDDDPVALGSWYADADDDGHGDPGVVAEACDAPEGYVATDDDCDDAEPLAWTGAGEVCGDGVDNDCDGAAGACVVSGALGPDDASHAYTGVAYGVAGQGLAITPDADGDGVRDLLIGAPLGSFGADGHEGRAYLASGASGGPLSTTIGSITGRTGQARAGSALAALGDLDGDGDAELAVGAPGTFTGLEYDPGVVHVLRTSASGAPTIAASVEGTDATSSFGAALAALGDVDGDGAADLAVGAYAQNYYEGTRTGAVWLLTDVPTSGNAVADDVGIALLGPTNSYTGRSVANVGDTDGDGRDDLLASGYAFTGGAFAWLLTATPTADADLGDVAAAAISTSSATDGAGNFVGGAGDVDGDGLADVMVGAFQDDDGGTDAGAMYVFTAPTGDLALSGAYAKLSGETGDNAGISGCALGDLDGDGRGEIAVGAWLASRGGAQSGAVFLHAGPEGRMDLWDTAFATFQGDAGAWTGQRVVAGDLDGTGPALAIAAPGADSRFGAVYLLPLVDL